MSLLLFQISNLCLGVARVSVYADPMQRYVWSACGALRSTSGQVRTLENKGREDALPCCVFTTKTYFNAPMWTLFRLWASTQCL